MLLDPAPPRRLIAALLGLAAVVLGAVAVLRSTEYDENYTVFLAAGTPRPDWPREPVQAGDLRHVFAGASDAASIARDLRATDVHPPLYFWAAAAWRGVVGTGLLETRLLSVAFAVAALAAVAAVARAAALPPAASLLLTLGFYGFAYTGAIARGFALAQLLLLLGLWALLQSRDARRGLAAGLALGAATFANYLAAFVGAAALLWRLCAFPRAWPVWLAAGLGFAAFIAADLYFFLAQRDSRAGQFPPFALVPSLVRLAQYGIAAFLGGLPLYFDGVARLVVGGLAVIWAGLLAGIVAWRWRRIATPAVRWLLLMCAAATPLGLLALGFVFDNTPIELRYLAFAVPPAALLLAGALAAMPRGGTLLLVVLAVQVPVIAGLALHPATMQPPRAAARDAARLAGAEGLVLVPHGNDGVGVPAPFVTEAPDWLRLIVVRGAADVGRAIDRAGSFPRAVVPLLEVDAESRATVPRLIAALQASGCWREGALAERAIAFERAC